MRFIIGSNDCVFFSYKHYQIGILISLLSLSVIDVVKGSIHEYKNEGFIPRFNSFFVHGGSEGMYASKVHNNGSTEDKPINGKSFVRYKPFSFSNFDF